jgi:hypothetical protein
MQNISTLRIVSSMRRRRVLKAWQADMQSMNREMERPRRPDRLPLLLMERLLLGRPRRRKVCRLLGQ